MMGVKPAQVAEKFKSLDVAAIGANCGTTLENMEKIVQEYAAAQSGLFIWAKPNAGLPTVDAATGRSVYNVTPEQMGEFAKRYVAARRAHRGRLLRIDPGTCEGDCAGGEGLI